MKTVRQVREGGHRGHTFCEPVYEKCPQQVNPETESGWWWPGAGEEDGGVTANVYRVCLG